VLLVHRPAYDDWTLPKGKLELDETWEHAALREVAEETNLSCELGAELGRTHYVDRGGREKEVRYFLMTATDEPTPRNEIDEVRWVPLGDAPALLSYERDAELLSLLA
jgi:8-oxo-dGTP diphosphatase